VKILLTGSTGFVGKYVSALIPGCYPLAEGDKFVDLRDARQVEGVVCSIKPEAVIHLAAQSSVPDSFRAPKETFQINFLGTLNLLEALKLSRFAGRFLFVGSGDVYGLVPDTDLPVVEDYPLHPRNPYAASKVAAEALCYQWSQTERIEIVMARPFNHCGPGQNDRFVIGNLSKQVRRIRLGLHPPVLHVGDIDVSRDFTDVRDVVRAYHLLLLRGRNGQIYNVCSGKQYCVRELMTSMLRIAGIEPQIEDDKERFRIAEQRNMCGSLTKISEEIGWQPKIPIVQSLTDVLNEEENADE
jgi:GDP-4-dehydro-6-deoxy-D-mannose reductase